MKHHSKRKSVLSGLRPSESATKLFQEMHAPVDPDRFVEMTHAFNEGVLAPLNPYTGAGYHLTDIPLNRAMMTVYGACRESNLTADETEAMMTRLMLMGQVVQAGSVFEKYIRISADGRSTDLATVLVKAIAVARIKPHGEHARFDLDDVLLHAQRFEVLESQPK